MAPLSGGAILKHYYMVILNTKSQSCAKSVAISDKKNYN